MNSDPLNTYRTMIVDTEAPDYLPDRVLQQAHAQSTQHSAAQPNRPSAHRMPSTKHPRTKRLAIAACTVLALGAGTLAVASYTGWPNTGNEGSPAQASSTIPGPFDFSIKAYASSTNTLLSFGDNGMIAFDRETLTGLPQKPAYYSEGFFTGCLFRIQGDNIASASASIDRGQLYAYTANEFIKSSDPERWTEALSWKPSKTGNGGYYGAYDAVQPEEMNDGLDHGDPNKLCRVALLSLLGQSTTINADNLSAMNAGDYSIGLWTNEDYDDSSHDIFGNVIDTLDGAHLTITTTFTDGSVSTKIIELHAGDLKGQYVDAEYGGTRRFQILPEFANAEDKKDSMFIHSLYGVVVDESYTPGNTAQN
jgi:hypothetical protein